MVAVREQLLAFSAVGAIAALVLSAYFPTAGMVRGEVRLTLVEQFLVIVAIGCFGREFGPMIALTILFFCMPFALIAGGLRRWVNLPPPERSVDLLLALIAVGSLLGGIAWLGVSIGHRS